MDQSSYAAALDAIAFDEHITCIHYYDSNQEGSGMWKPRIRFLLNNALISRRFSSSLIHDAFRNSKG